MHLRILHRTWVWFPAPTSGSLQPPVTPAQENQCPPLAANEVSLYCCKGAQDMKGASCSHSQRMSVFKTIHINPLSAPKYLSI